MPVSTQLPRLSQRAGGTTRSPVRDLLALTENPDIISFAGGLPAPELFDLEGLRRSFDAALAAPVGLQYSTSEGNPALREFIAERYTAQGLPTSRDEILVTTGSQQALSLLALALIDPGDTVLVERPSYLAALQAFTLAGARIVSVPMTAEGIDLDALGVLAEQHRPKLLYTVPTFQNPTGGSLGLATRSGLARLAAEHGFRIIEDEPYRELRYSGDPMPYLAARSNEHVITVGSFSKVLAPGLRLGWIRTRADLHSAVVVTKQAADLHTSTVDQAAAAHYLTGGGLESALDRIRSAYGERRDAMLAALPQTLPAGSTWTTPHGGMFVWATMPPGHDSTRHLAAAIEQSVAYVPGAPFYAERPDASTMRLSFTTYDPARIREGLRRLERSFVRT
ncbi:transcriptional regulator [Agromyces sp. Root81]|uniref:aminotransferase-like domain-containing protein n=1 Tax=Agromyces sp. Root81 TaxID=1736601 RepID=UPI0006FA8C43|nr:PLP-dependent aminotransferase family protein [Agromyces sp. Root81]KRC62345.1 transcriptional regulator [Agromyces sp. Root81]